jgi:hypothetical protein
MSNDYSYRPRFSFEITEEQKVRADKLIDTYGLRKLLFGIILDDLLDIIESYGPLAIGAIMSHKAKPRDLMPSLKKAEKIGEL